MWKPFLPVARQALNDPREAATTLMSMGVPRDALWPAFALFIVLSAILSTVMSVVLSTVSSVALIFGVWKIGQAMEGTGTFEETLLVFVFLQGIILIGQAVVFVAYIVATPIAWMLMLGVGFYSFWLSVNFVAALHGFPSLWRALGCLLLAYGGVLLALVVVMTLLGVQMVGGPV